MTPTLQDPVILLGLPIDGWVVTYTGRYMLLFYLTLLDDFDAIPIYNWGFIVLACLYRHLYLERGQIGWRMFATSTCMNERI
uniref:Aminotransferase-like plant mobile domain-containing protein n=1 Tax=Populus trichocarpa TaxID=3694 RepID=A0A2K1YQQ9_POPTR